MDWTVRVLALVYCDTCHDTFNIVWPIYNEMNEILIFVLFVSAIIFISFRLGKERGTMLASERAVDIMIAMGYLKEKTNGEIEKVDNDK